jgi:CheY-like chemotaxis protein
MSKREDKTAAAPAAPGRRSGSGADSVLRHLARDVKPGSAQSTEPSPRLRRAGHTILVVEDQPAARYAASKMLQNAGFRTLETGSGYEAITMAGSASAVLLDINLPDVHGVQVCTDLRSGKATQKLPVVLTSAVYVDDLHREAGLAAGADAYLVAPLVPEELISTFDRLLP